MSLELKDHKIIITGVCGTIGSALSNRLSEAGAFVVGFDKIDAGNLKCRLIKGDLLDRSFLMDAFQEVQQGGPITTIFHLAGLGDAKQCEAHPSLAFKLNTSATVNVLEASAKNKIKHFVFPSTAYVYGTDYPENIKEDWDTHPKGVYSLTKLAAEIAAKVYADFGKINCDILRISNVYGPHLKSNTVLGSLMSQSEVSDKIFLETLTPVRDFIYIDDVIEALFRIVGSYREGFNILNISTGVGVSVDELVELFCNIKGIPSEGIQSSSYSEKNLSRLVLDNQALYERLQWKPSVVLKEGLRKTLEIKYGVGKNVKA